MLYYVDFNSKRDFKVCGFMNREVLKIWYMVLVGILVMIFIIMLILYIVIGVRLGC